MVLTLDLPVLSLAIPNIHKLNDINADNLSCLWTVFSKCKENLENGRRLENMSWRLWYRESSLANTPTFNQQPISPIPIKSTNNSLSNSHGTPRHLTPSSFKRIISSMTDDKIPIPLNITHKSPTEDHTHTAPTVDTPKVEEEDEWLSEDEEPQQKLVTKKITIKHTTATKIRTSPMNKKQRQQQRQPKKPVTEQNDEQKDGCLTEFKKCIPMSKLTQRRSLLSNMLHAQNDTRLANSTVSMIPSQIQTPTVDDLSTSMKEHVEWEKHLQTTIIKSTLYKNNTYIDTFSGW
ncbi:hypothetical protein BDB01DRAFT_784185 [Pilobolus umbonatus]|nr:hypothetical protein BDB01DRAFT_784185 [Pilobolus umbonatus]